MLSRTNVLTYLEDSTRRNPNATAVVDESGTYTYARLLEDTQRIGTALASRGASGSSVIIMLRKSELALACMLGTLQAGAFYVPVDTDAPAHRLQHMAATLGDALVVAGEKNVDAVHQALPERKVLVAEELLRHPVDAEALEAARSHVLSCDPAYVMFTSGSTGTPKGVAVSHGAIASFVDEFVRTFGITAKRPIGQPGSVRLRHLREGRVRVARRGSHPRARPARAVHAAAGPRRLPRKEPGHRHGLGRGSPLHRQRVPRAFARQAPEREAGALQR